MEIGGNDIVAKGAVSAGAGDFIRKALLAAWPEAVLMNADIEDEILSMEAGTPHGDLWSIPTEVFIFTDISETNGDPGRFVHLFIEKFEITMVVDDQDIEMAHTIIKGLRAEGLLGE
jgi:hypothetical protein